MKSVRRYICMVVAVLCTGCATIWAPPRDDAEARRLIDMVTRHNVALKQYKALTYVRVQANGNNLSGRVAIAAVTPDMLRLEWLSAIGQPLTRLAGNGSYIEYILPGEPRIRRMRQTATSLESLIQIPIGIPEVQSLVTGRPSLPDFAAAQVLHKDDTRIAIALINRWGRLLSRIEVDSDQGRVLRLERMNSDGKIIYSIHWDHWQQRRTYTIPEHVDISTPEGQRLEMRMVRFMPDVDVPASIFQLATSMKRQE